MGLSRSLRKCAFLLNWSMWWWMMGTHKFAIPALQRWCRAWWHVSGCLGYWGHRVLTKPLRLSHVQECPKMRMKASVHTYNRSRRKYVEITSITATLCEKLNHNRSVILGISYFPSSAEWSHSSVVRWVTSKFKTKVIILTFYLMLIGKSEEHVLPYTLYSPVVLTLC